MRIAVSLVAVTFAMLAVPQVVDAQAIQLPTFRLFSTNSTVLVPDRGSAYLGGVDRASYGSNQRGLSRSIGSSVGSSGVTVHATIIDHEEMDRALLAEAARKRGDTHDVLGRPIDGRSGHLDQPLTRPPTASTPEVSRAEAIRRKAAFLSRHVSRNSR